jgi:hypothetical protein
MVERKGERHNALLSLPSFYHLREGPYIWNREMICSVGLVTDKELADFFPYLNSMDSFSGLTRGKPFCLLWRGERRGVK